MNNINTKDEIELLKSAKKLLLHYQSMYRNTKYYVLQRSNKR